MKNPNLLSESKQPNNLLEANEITFEETFARTNEVALNGRTYPDQPRISPAPILLRTTISLSIFPGWPVVSDSTE